MLAEENQRLRARCAQLEQRHLDMLGVYERSMTLEHERKISEIAMNASEQRSRKRFGRSCVTRQWSNWSAKG